MQRSDLGKALVDDLPAWSSHFKTVFLKEVNETDMKILRLQIHASVGHTEVIVRESGLLDRLKYN